MPKRISVLELSPVCVTRRRGAEAYEKLRPHLSRDRVEIDLSGVDLLSASFLDAIVSRLDRFGQLDGVIFVADDPASLNKLERIAGVHDIAVRVRSEGEASSRLVNRKRVRADFTHTEKKEPTMDDA